MVTTRSQTRATVVPQPRSGRQKKVTTRSQTRAAVIPQPRSGRQQKAAATTATKSAISRRSRFSWFSLPPEIRTMILDEVARAQFPGWASSAAPVCKEWHALIAPRNFHRLNLWASDLPKLERMVSSARHQRWVRHISLSMQLPAYNCSSCRWNDRFRARPKHMAIMGRALLGLLTVLSAWEPAEHGGIELELNARSPSDTGHWVKDHCAGLEYEPDGERVEAQRGDIKRYHDPKHAWLSGKQTGRLFHRAIGRPYTDIDIYPPGDLPAVPAITGLVIRRGFRRQITPAALRLLFAKLPRLEKLVYEPWRVHYEPSLIAAHRGALASLLRDHLPPGIKTVAVYEEFSEQLAAALHQTVSILGHLHKYKALQDPYAIGGGVLDRALVRRSQSLEELAVSYLVDAAAFFHDCSRQAYRWPRLRSLTLTAPRLSAPDNAREASDLLQMAGLVAARQMPRLERLVLWNARHEQTAWAFTYEKQAGKRQATIQLRGTWILPLERRVVGAWEKVVASLGSSACCQLVVKESELLQGVTIQSRGDAIYHLRLPTGSLTPCRCGSRASMGWRGI
ncbi:hypothetical protein PG991_008133 [Apiospora marii]|uniref:DUF6546 domain-containing protein n=1 Tax=Apiospora marii TaxID=335849 RepID=A0ABR1RVE9_9PEZI